MCDAIVAVTTYKMLPTLFGGKQYCEPDKTSGCTGVQLKNQKSTAWIVQISDFSVALLGQ